MFVFSPEHQDADMFLISLAKLCGWPPHVTCWLPCKNPLGVNSNPFCGGNLDCYKY